MNAVEFMLAEQAAKNGAQSGAPAAPQAPEAMFQFVK
jgi:hypothetical protein